MDLPPDESANLEELEAFSKVIIKKNTPSPSYVREILAISTVSADERGRDVWVFDSLSQHKANKPYKYGEDLFCTSLTLHSLVPQTDKHLP